MKRIKLYFAALAVALFGALALAPVGTVAAIDPLEDVCKGSNASSAICQDRKNEDATKLIGTIVNILFWAVGLLSVIMIIVSGILYVISSGDAPKVAKAKNTLTYSIVGLVVAMLAYAIVFWVLDIF